MDKLSEENGWTETERAREERLLSDFMKATKTGDETAAKQAWQQMKPETQQEIEAQQKIGLDVQNDVSAETIATATDLRTKAAESTEARADIFEDAADVDGAPANTDSPAKETALLNPPDIKLSEAFASAAADKPASPVSEPQLQLASVAPTPKAAAPVLSQEFSI